MRFIVFECRKCGHHLYVENTEGGSEKYWDSKQFRLPHCGEEPDGNWVLIGLRKEFPVEFNDEVRK